MRAGNSTRVFASLALAISSGSIPGFLASAAVGSNPLEACDLEAASCCHKGRDLLQLQFGADVVAPSAKLSSGELSEREHAHATRGAETREHRQPVADRTKVENLRVKDTEENAASLDAKPHGPLVLRVLAIICLTLSVIMFVVMLLNDSKQNQKLSRSAVSFAHCCSSHALRSESMDDIVGACPSLPELKDLSQVAKAGGIVSLVENLAKSNPSQRALIDNADGSVMTYQQLFARVQALAQQLQNAGVDNGDIVALLFKPSRTLIVAALGVMHAGAIWLPLDADSPSARLQQLLELAGSRLGLSFKPMDEISDPPICSLGPDCLLQLPKLTLPALPAKASCPVGSAAVFFTSGSTGTPKGVIYGHETLLHGTISMAWLCSMNSQTMSLLKSPPYWAVIEYEMFPALIAGGTIVCDSHCQTDTPRLSNILIERQITVLMTSDQVLRLLIQGAWKGSADLLQMVPTRLAHMVNVGGPLSLDTCAEVNAVMPNVMIHNIYGCTESACTQWTYTPRILSSTGMKRAPAGRPQPGAAVYIVDANLRPVKQDEEGEICFGGAYLSYGYLGDRQLTEARFVTAPHKGEKIYRTGDVGRWVVDPGSPDGLALEVIGRVDRQLNLRGVRVAPEEIEAVLVQAPGVQEAAVVVTSTSIVAYVKGADAKDVSVSAAARELCHQKLAANMRPVLIRQLAAMPHLRNGKVDLAALARRAADDLKQDMVEAVDSLGMMQRVSKGQVAELHTLAAARGLATAANLLWHWYWVFPASEAGPRWQGPSQAEFDQTIPSKWLQILLSGFLGYEWTTQVFIMASAYTERQTAERVGSIYPRQELFTFVLYLALWWPLPILFTKLLSGMGNTYLKCSLEDFINFRWYLAVYLLCRILHRTVLVPLEESFRSVPANVAHLGRAFFASSLWLVQLAYGGWNMNICPGLDPNGYAFKAMEFLWPLTWKPTPAETYCSAIFHPWFISSLALYVSAWFYGHSLVAWVRETTWLRLVPLPWTATFFLLVLLLGYPPVQEYLHQFGDIFYWISCFYSVLMFMALAQWSDGPWLRLTGLAWSGHASLGTYCFHMYFLCEQYCPDPAGADLPLVLCDRGLLYFSYNNVRIIPAPAEMMRKLIPYGGLVQLSVLLAYFFFFTLFVGMPLQFACLKFYSSAEQVVLHTLDIWKGKKLSPRIRL